MPKVFCKPYADEIYAEIRERVIRLQSRRITPKLVTILVGDDEASKVYVRRKLAKAQQIGVEGDLVQLPANTPVEVVAQMVSRVCARSDVHGVLLQLPLPSKEDPTLALQAVDPLKDVDGFHADNLGKMMCGIEDLPPATPAGIIYLLERKRVKLSGAHVVLVGSSIVVGKPLSVMLMNRGATVTVCNKSTKDLAKVCATADILISATGVAKLIRAAHVKKGAIVVDVGFTRGKDGKLVGDVLEDTVLKKCKWLTPVPGGVGVLTVAMLMRNLVHAAELQSGIK